MTTAVMETRDPVTILLKRIKVLGTFNDSLGEISDGAIYIRNNRIEWVGTTDSLPLMYTTADRVLDLSDHVVIPGMRLAHRHPLSTTFCSHLPRSYQGWYDRNGEHTPPHVPEPD
jgi:cytosine/adenosine deaminase-related metal-dependent hydrolase